jgi:hypothetical protein
VPKDPCTVSFKSLRQGVLSHTLVLLLNFGTSGDFGNPHLISVISANQW